MNYQEMLERLRDEHIAVSRTEAADCIEKLVKERDEWIAHAKNAIWSDSEELKLTQAKLAKAVEWFKKLDRRGDALETFDPVVHEVVTAALAELEGGK